MRLLIVGYGKMGQLVEQMAVAEGIEIASRIDVGKGDWSSPADVAVDFSTTEALTDNFPRYVQRKLPVVLGTTGWADLVALFQQEAERGNRRRCVSEFFDRRQPVRDDGRRRGTADTVASGVRRLDSRGAPHHETGRAFRYGAASA